ncbi:MAG: hypothetical protein L6435_12555 [Anaerolineae bacterium]|nr:hypothetical protein [Anaerolineae bacterium]
MSRKRVILLLLSILLGTSLLLGSSVVFADSSIPPLSSPFRIGYEKQVAHHPVVVYNPDMLEYLVVWSSASAEDGDGDIWAQRISWDGESRGDLISICDTEGDQLSPDVSYCPTSGEYLVTWEDHRAKETLGADVRARRVGADGQLIGDELTIAVGPGDQLNPQIAYNVPAQQYLIVWQECGNNRDESDIFGQWLVADGGRAGDCFPICNSDGKQSVPVVVADLSRSRCLVAWEDARHSSWKLQDIYARFVATGSQLEGPELPIATSPGPEYSPTAAYNPVLDEYLILWEDEIGGQRLTGEGEPVGSSFSLFRASPYLRKPALMVDADSGDWVMVWEGRCETGPQGVDIYARRFSEEGKPLGDVVLLCNDGSNQFAPAIAYNSYRGDLLVVWSDDLLGNDSLVVLGRIFMLVP